MWLKHECGKGVAYVRSCGYCTFKAVGVVCGVVEGVALLAVDVVALCCALCAEDASTKEASWVRAM